MKDWIGCLISSRVINDHLPSTTTPPHPPISGLAFYFHGVAKKKKGEKKVLKTALTSAVVFMSIQTVGGGDLFL